MKLRRNAPIEKIIPRPDKEDRITSGVSAAYFRPDAPGASRGILSATDGFSCLVLAVDCRPEDQEGAVSRDAIESARKLYPVAKSEDPFFEIELDEALVTFRSDDGNVHIDRRPADQFPNLEKIRLGFTTRKDGVRCALNARHLHDLAKAIGTDRLALTVYPHEKGSWIHVEPADADISDVRFAMLAGLRLDNTKEAPDAQTRFAGVTEPAGDGSAVFVDNICPQCGEAYNAPGGMSGTDPEAQPCGRHSIDRVSTLDEEPSEDEGDRGPDSDDPLPMQSDPPKLFPPYRCTKCAWHGNEPLTDPGYPGQYGCPECGEEAVEDEA